MPEHSAGPPGDEPGIRPEVVQAVFSALVDMDPGKLAPLEANGIRITLPSVSSPTSSTSQHVGCQKPAYGCDLAR
jgi:hypothetical protein